VSAQARPSRTAELMAIQRGLESCRRPSSRLFSDPLARDFLSWRWRLVLSAARLRPVRAAVEAPSLYDAIGGPGPRASAVARTRLIDELIADASADVSQIVILGAGFDTRAYRLAELAGRVVFEVDRAPTQALKRSALARSAADPVASVVFVPVDLERDELRRALADAGHDADLPSLFLWEGVSQYLSAAAVDATLAGIRGSAMEQGTLVFTYVDSHALDGVSAAFPEAARWLRGVSKRGEPWIFGLDPARVGEYLSERGFALIDDVSTAAAGERYFRPRGRADAGSGLYHVASASVGAGQRR